MNKGINRENKDRLFKFIFGNEKNKAWTLSLYNAVNGSSYSDPEAIEFTTIDDVLYMGMKNDISFLIADIMNIYEHQVTFNPNMPMRFLIYLGMIYSKYTENNKHRMNLYSTTLQKYPLPKLVCFYNGLADTEDKMELRLTDAFDTTKGEPDVEVKVTMLNINYGRNTELMNSCQVLQEYAWFVERIRKNQEETGELEKAVALAISQMPDDALIKSFIVANKAEVTRMCITEYDEAQTMEMFREEGRREGQKEGRKEGRIEGRMELLFDFVQQKIISTEEAARQAELTVEDFNRRMETYQKS